MSKINNENIEPNMMMNQNKTNDELVIIHEIINSQTADPYSTGGILTEEDIMIHQDRMRKQLLLMIHAQRCNLNDKKNNNKKCTWILCECMQKTFIHMSNCYKTTDCGTPHCYSSKTIAKHWKTCLNENCFLCKPIRLQEKKQNLNLATTSLNTTEKQMPIRQIELHQMIINNNDGYTKQWQMNLSQDLRNHFIFKLVEIMHPAIINIINFDVRYYPLFLYSKKVENETFIKANSKIEYLHIIAQNIYEIEQFHLQKQITINQQKQLIIENNNQQVSQELRTNVRKQKPRAIPIDKSFKPSSQLTSTSNNTGKVSSKPTTLSSSVTLNSNTQSTSVAPNDQQPVELPTVSSNLNIQSASVTPNDQQPVASPTVPSNLNTQLTLDAQNNNQQKNIETPTTELTSDTLINKQTLESSTASLNSNTQSTSDAQNNNQQENIETPTDTSQPIAQLTSDTLNDERAVESPGASSNSSTQLTFDTPGNYQTINNEAPSVPSANQASVIKSLETQSDENQTMDIDEIDNTNENEKIISTIEQLLSNNIPNKPQYKKYKFPMKQNDLAKALKPVFYRIYNQHPEASPFHRGVSRTHSKLSNYYDIIKNPIDLSIIGRKINGKKYYEPWEFVDDIWLLIENAWLYNTENSRIYGYAKKLSVIFEETMIPVMTSLGYCCAKSYKYNYDNLICCAKEHCKIKANGIYYIYNDYIICNNCYTNIKNTTIDLIDSKLMSNKITINKNIFIKKYHNNSIRELFVTCDDCGKRLHQICVCKIDSIINTSYTCDNCSKKKNMEINKVNNFTANNLPVTKLSSYIEKKVINYLVNRYCYNNKIMIRVLSSKSKKFKAKKNIKNINNNDSMNGEYSYKSKSIFAFQLIDNIEVCFFGMYVQEYNDNCQMPNTRKVYVSHFDTVNYFSPKQYKTNVYYEIILSYFEYVKKLGYTSIHLWSRPPAKNQDFIFNKHPYEQIILDAQQLQKWINKMVGIGIFRKIINDYKNIKQLIFEDNIKSFNEIPYFYDDYWPDFIEDTIDKAKDNDDAWSKIINEIEIMKDSFIIINLYSKDDEKQLGPINDPDLDIDCDLMNERSRFVNVTRDNYLEFSTLRCAKFSTMVMLSEIHKQSNYFHKNKVTVDRRIAALTHGYQCTDDYCQSNDCNEMKKVIKHSLSCLSKFDTTDCAICKEFIQLKVCHAKSCRLTVCPVRSCLVIKKKLLNKNLIIVNSEKRKRSIDNDEDSDRSKKIQKVTNDSSVCHDDNNNNNNSDKTKDKTSLKNFFDGFKYQKSKSQLNLSQEQQPLKIEQQKKQIISQSKKQTSKKNSPLLVLFTKQRQSGCPDGSSNIKK
ncbi:hypothetical protein HCN44_007417 [Aphidius gifuensis]|uniref:histone acetyltransferase n=1 Tax=Aphidius gifuensis TaxID=684658 RepID=A0A834XP73_APHGI|nr:hypothetical protein HCN44_007417 [Aphidius gifuensis]